MPEYRRREWDAQPSRRLRCDRKLEFMAKVGLFRTLGLRGFACSMAIEIPLAGDIDYWRESIRQPILSSYPGLCIPSAGGSSRPPQHQQWSCAGRCTAPSFCHWSSRLFVKL